MGVHSLLADSVFALEGVCVRRDGRSVLSNVSLEVGISEKIFLMGPNGAGKSTLLKILAGMERPSSGKFIFGVGSDRRPDVRALRRNVSLVSNSMVERFLGGTTAIQVVLTGISGDLAPYWHSYSLGDEGRALEALASMGLSGKARQSFSLLSQGERQRCVIARSLMARSEVVLLDEPFVGLDLMAREELVQYLDRLSLPFNDLKAIVLVAHYPEEIPRSFTRALLLKDGSIAADGAVEEIVTSQRLSALYGREMAVLSAYGRRMVVFPVR